MSLAEHVLSSSMLPTLHLNSFKGYVRAKRSTQGQLGLMKAISFPDLRREGRKAPSEQ